MLSRQLLQHGGGQAPRGRAAAAARTRLWLCERAPASFWRMKWTWGDRAAISACRRMAVACSVLACCTLRALVLLGAACCGPAGACAPAAVEEVREVQLQRGQAG